MRARRFNPVGIALILSFITVLGIVCVKCVHAEGEKQLRFRQHLPMYVATDYSTSEEFDKDDTPYLKAQASLAASLLRNPVVVGPVSLDPEIAFTWRAVNWPVGAESSPIVENNYLPEAFLRVNEDESGWFRGGRVGWLHNSTGTGGDSLAVSGSIDRVLLESKFGYEVPFQSQTIYLTGYVRGWYVTGTGASTNGIQEFINFKLWDSAGGELMAMAELPGTIRVVVNLGLSYQDYEVYIPFAPAYDLDLFGHLHNGNANGILDYEDRATSGGVGIALVR